MINDNSKLAILGGTFDPLHIGHLIIAEQAVNKYDLDRVIFMPAGIPPHKDNYDVTHSRHRLEMVRMGVDDNPFFIVSEWELKRKGKSYTVETLRYLQRKKSDPIYLIIGADSLYDIFNWREPDYLLNHARFIVASRAGYAMENFFKNQQFRKYEENIDFLDCCKTNISSTMIRKLVQKGDSIRYLVPDDIREYIIHNNLYQG